MMEKINKEINIGNFTISKDSPCFVIAEAGVNHNGDIEMAKKLIDVAVEAKVDAVKFQMSSGNIDAGTIKLYGLKDS